MSLGGRGRWLEATGVLICSVCVCVCATRVMANRHNLYILGSSLNPQAMWNESWEWGSFHSPRPVEQALGMGLVSVPKPCGVSAGNGPSFIPQAMRNEPWE